jgi:TctA family transporter
MVSSSNAAFMESLWNMIVSHARSGAHDFAIWTARLSDAERIVGLCVFALTIMILMMGPTKRRKAPRGKGTQFVFALAIVMIFGFGAGWLFEDNAGVGEFVSTLF